MKKVLYALLALLALVILAALIAPSFFNPNKYKTQIQSEFRKSTGYTLDIKGNIELTLFPVPKAYIKDAAISNNTQVLAQIQEISAYPQLSKLISGDFAINSVLIEKPVITLEKNVNGYNWQIIHHKEDLPDDKSAATSTSQTNLSINSIGVKDGEVQYNDNIKSKNYDFKKVSLESSLASLKGPFNFDVSMNYNDKPITAKGKVDNFDNPQISFDSTILDNKITYNGSLQKGSFSIKTQDISPLLDLAGTTQLQQLAKLPINISGDAEYTPEKAGVENIKLTVGDTIGGGSVTATIGDNIAAVADLKFQKINLDQLWPQPVSAPPAKDGQKPTEEPTGPPTTKPLSADITLASDQVTFKGAPYTNLLLKTNYDNGEVTLQPFDIGLANNGKMEVYGVMGKDTQGRTFDGHIDIAAPDLRSVLQALKFDVTTVKTDALKNFSFDSELIFSLRDKTRLDLPKIVMTADDSILNGSLSADLDGMPNISLNATISKLDLNKYFAPDPKAKPVVEDKSHPAGATNDKPFEIIWLEKLPVKATANISVGSIAYGDDIYSSVRLKGNFKPGELNFDEISAASRKIQFAAKGFLTAAAGKKPHVGVEVNLGKINVADFIKAPVAAADKAAAKPADGKVHWSTDPIDLSVLRRINVDATANSAALINGKYVFTNLATKVYVEDNKLVIEKLTSDIFGGNISAKGNIIASAVPAFAVSAIGSNVDVYSLLDAISGNERVQGKITFNMGFSSAGVHQMAMISNMKGESSFTVTGASIKGFDIDGFVKQLTNITDPSGVLSIARTISGEQAITYLSSIAGAFTCEDGVCRTPLSGIQLTTASSGQGVYTGYADFVKWYMDGNANFNLVIPGDTAKQLPAIGIHIYGSLDDPQKDINYDAIKRYITQRVSKLLLKGNVIPSLNSTVPAATPDIAPQPDQPQKPAKLGKQLLKNLLNKNQ